MSLLEVTEAKFCFIVLSYFCSSNLSLISLILFFSEIENVLTTVIHALDPPGIGFRNIKECIYIQLKRKNIELGISDGINVEIISGLSMEDKIKVWNKTEPIKIGEEDDSVKK